MKSQKYLFDLPEDVHYLNGAYMSPLMKSVQEAGILGIKRKLNPSTFLADDFFVHVEPIKQKFARLINAPAQQIALIPSVSYGLRSAINNIPLNTGNHAVVVGHEFPSDYYAVQEWCRTNNKELKTISSPAFEKGRGAAWGNKILQSITTDTAAVIMSTIHWSDGTKFDLAAIGEKCAETNTLFIADGTQSVGALPMDVNAFKLNALICAGYKWLMGPYSCGLAYYSEKFNQGIPIENSWMNRSNAEDFTRLTQYSDEYKPGAARYNVGEFSNPILMPMLDTALSEVEKWSGEAIQDYCGDLIQPLVEYLNSHGYWFEESEFRTNHLFGFLLPGSVNKNALLNELQNQKVFVSLRGDVIRVSPHVYNEERDIDALINILEMHKP